MGTSSTSSLNALKLLQERFTPGNSSDILSEEKMIVDEVRRKSTKDKRPGRPKGSVNKKKNPMGNKGQKVAKVAKLDSSDNDDDTAFSNEGFVEEPSYHNPNLSHYSKNNRSHQANQSVVPSRQQPLLFDCQECRYQAGSYEQYQDHLRKNTCGPRRPYGPPLQLGVNGGPPGYQLSTYRKSEPLFHQQYNFRGPHQGLYHYNGGPMISPQYSPRQRVIFPSQPHHSEFIRGCHPLRCPSYSWNDYSTPPPPPPPQHHSNMYPPYGYVPPPIHSSKPYFYKPHEPTYANTKKIYKNGSTTLPYSSVPSSSSSIIGGQSTRDNEPLDLEEAIASIQSEEDEGNNQLVEEVIAFVDGKKQKIGREQHKRSHCVDALESKNYGSAMDENTYLKDCSRDPVLTATSGFVIPMSVSNERDKVNKNLEDIVNGDSLVLNGNLSSDASTETIFDEENLRLIFENNFETQLCPHKSVLELPCIPSSEQAKDQLRIITLQAQLAYVLTGLMGYAKLNSDYDYSRSSVHHILHKVLAESNIKPIEENYLCSTECETSLASLDKKELYLRIIKLRLHVIRANIGKLLCICVPHRNEWKKFHWDGLTIDEILDNLTAEDIPSNHEQILSEVHNELKDQEDSGEQTVYLMEINEEAEILQALENGGEIEIPNEDQESQS